MSLPSSIAHYKITAKLGEGGMGAVYRAVDTKLEREVAIKIIPDVFSRDPDRMARFTREAQVLASLNHPNIAAIYGVEDRALVMELVEGETLADRIARGPVPFDEAAPILRQIADAVEAAHDRGVIHRDLKPANIKIKPDGTVKVLDFGLAKASEGGPRSTSDPAASPTLTIQATQAGIILGTAAYMPPEQARGLTVDKRADVWAFGCVLYEMLTGRRLFDGQSTTDVLAAVVRAEPDWSLLPPDTPAPIVRLAKRCLQKDRKLRLPDIGVARFEIDDALAPVVKPAAVVAATVTQRSRLPWLIAAIAVLLIPAAVFWESKRVLSQEVWSGTMLGGPFKAFLPRLAPDGQMLLFVAMEDQIPQVGVMKPNSGSWTILTHDKDHGYVTTAAWAHDGSKIYFDRMVNRPLGIYSIPPLGGESRLILEDAFSPEPLADGSMVVAKLTDRGDQQLFHFWPDSGKLEPLPAYIPLTDIAPMLRAFPDGKEIVFAGNSEAGRTQSPRMLVLDLASGKSRDLAPGYRADVGSASWEPLSVSPRGDSVYLAPLIGDSQTLMEYPRKSGAAPRPVMTFPALARPVGVDAAPDGSLYFDLYQRNASILRIAMTGGAGEELPLTQGVLVVSSLVAPGGDMFVSVPSNGRRRLSAVHPGSEPRPLVETSEDTSTPATIFNNNVAFVIGSGDQRRIALASLRDGRVIRRYSGRADNGLVASPDGATLYYSFAGGIWSQPVAGGDPRRLTDGIDVTNDPQGKYLYIKRTGNNSITILRIPAAGGPAELLPVPDDYPVAEPGLAPAAVDSRGRLLITVSAKNSFYYKMAMIDTNTKTFTLVKSTLDGDIFSPGWAPDGQIVATGQRYLFSLWHYRRTK